jgi:hypothetical protein
MRRILMTLALAGLFGSLALSSVARAGCQPNECATQATPKHASCHSHERCKQLFARWDACREKFSEKLDKCLNPTCCQNGCVYAVAPCAVPVVTCPPVVPSGQGY